MSKPKRYRSSITGKYVSKDYAAKHPDTTIGEAVRPAEVVVRIEDRVERFNTDLDERGEEAR
jgi:hypothetical protein